MIVHWKCGAAPGPSFDPDSAGLVGTPSRTQPVAQVFNLLYRGFSTRRSHVPVPASRNPLNRAAEVPTGLGVRAGSESASATPLWRCSATDPIRIQPALPNPKAASPLRSAARTPRRFARFVADTRSSGQRVENPRYGRLQICATKDGLFVEIPTQLPVVCFSAARSQPAAAPNRTFAPLKNTSRHLISDLVSPARLCLNYRTLCAGDL